LLATGCGGGGGRNGDGGGDEVGEVIGAMECKGYYTQWWGGA